MAADRFVISAEHPKSGLAAIDIRRANFNESGGHSMSYRARLVKPEYAKVFPSQHSAEKWLKRIAEGVAGALGWDGWTLTVESATVVQTAASLCKI